MHYGYRVGYTPLSRYITISFRYYYFYIGRACITLALTDTNVDNMDCRTFLSGVATHTFVLQQMILNVLTLSNRTLL